MHKKAQWHLFVDGASRNNPGPAGAGIYLTKDHQKEFAGGFFLGTKTNNQAEYLALIIGLIIAIPKVEHEQLQIVSDSLLLVNQIKGIYRVKNPDLKLLHTKAMQFLNLVNYEVVHVLREKNKKADEMANLGVDQKIALSPEIKAKLHETNL